jgi:hypothetical protein
LKSVVVRLAEGDSCGASANETPGDASGLRSRLHDHQGFAPPAPDPREPHPQEAIAGLEGDSSAADLALEYEDLVAEREDLGPERHRASEQLGECQPERAEGRGHGYREVAR